MYTAIVYSLLLKISEKTGQPPFVSIPISHLSVKFASTLSHISSDEKFFDTHNVQLIKF